eukprot:TRINITY_DN11255_c0_g1_i1.p1 TRINITY_DN11255_c0_g1~~TRINITY_DN11255_c0_g1_i1.p1  ORF type:complete len:460 (+),score=82.88 TRINITY_DN11255_c0_g1_i1:1246-2625(+)
MGCGGSVEAKQEHVLEARPNERKTNPQYERDNSNDVNAAPSSQPKQRVSSYQDGNGQQKESNQGEERRDKSGGGPTPHKEHSFSPPRAMMSAAPVPRVDELAHANNNSTGSDGAADRKTSANIIGQRAADDSPDPSGVIFGASTPQPERDAPPVDLVVYKFKELQKATQNFSFENDLGSGGFGVVYKGWMKDHSSGEVRVVAVKRLNPGGLQGKEEWKSEIVTLGTMQHPNLVPLFGYCDDNQEALLVYEFQALGSLDLHLFPKPELAAAAVHLSWKARLKVALGAAEGLAYLHSRHIIHRDFKAPNVLLDEDLNAKLTDFGLARATGVDQTHVSTKIMGTMGYLDPKYLETGQVTKKSDMYAFGVMLLELLTGKPASSDVGDEPLAVWAGDTLARKKPNFHDFCDPRIRDEFETRSMQRSVHKLAMSAKWCISDDPNTRPQAADMIETIKSIISEREE